MTHLRHPRKTDEGTKRANNEIEADECLTLQVSTSGRLKTVSCGAIAKVQMHSGKGRKVVIMGGSFRTTLPTASSPFPRPIRLKDSDTASTVALQSPRVCTKNEVDTGEHA